MKNFLKIILSIVLIILFLGTIFYMIDTARVNNESEPIFTFLKKVIDGIDYSAKVNIGLGYKIIRFNMSGENEIIRTGSIFMDETPPIIEKNHNSNNVISGESGELIKITTFGEMYKDKIMIEGEETEVAAKQINSKLEYSMTYFYDLFDYTGYTDYDYYEWHLSSGDDKSTMTIYDISNEDAYKDSLNKITKDNMYQELSGDTTRKLYYRVSEEDGVNNVNYIYIIEENNVKLMVDLYYMQEAEEGIGTYMKKMTASIKTNL